MSSEKLKNKLEELNHHDGVIFSMRGVPSIDLTARAVFDEFQEKAEQRGQTIIYTSLQPEVENNFLTCGNIHSRINIKQLLMR